ncbi:hypothetical protein BC834DRAFT_387723 [Gloeopeniophorella convolvens]|nr:hypothetical protein BC834DRAFT_387723 [Gloeopeniophorella convolvens]
MAPSKASKGVAPDRLKGLLKPLGEAIINRPPYASGTVQLPGSRFSLFYKGAKDGFDAKWLDLASATPEQLEQLTQACQRATFGVKNEDVMDESYRKAGKMDADCFATPLMSDHPDLVKLVRGYFLEEPDSSRKIRIELYKLNVYDKDAFFKAHVDTPRSEKMFGSLVLVFPTPHEGGTLLLRHRGEEWAFNSAAELARAPACSLGYVVLFSDIEHEVTPVTEGYRVTLTYNLYFDDSKNDNRDETDASDETDTSDETSSMSESSSTPASALSSSPSQASANAPVVRQSSGEGKFRAAFEAALANPEFLPKGGTLGFGLRHAYQVEHGLEHVYSLLKGSDGGWYRPCPERGRRQCEPRRSSRGLRIGGAVRGRHSREGPG